MSKHVKHTAVTMICVSLVSFIASWLREAPLWFTFINIASLVSLALFMIGASLWILQSGMLDRTIRSFKMFNRHKDKIGQYVEQVAPQAVQTRPLLQFSVTYPFLWSGGLLFIGMYLISLAWVY
ncbi:DUF3899 domain-containing protein [Paenibacillus sp. KN14-4R]|uniref:DUF3899 domain-containing protein n=1 Tax=Paenibacillus sp. KN14-4R TaxID=3445773 RepID=UPI003FA0E0A5